MAADGQTLEWAADAGIDNSPERAWMRSLKVVPLGVGMFGSALADRAVRMATTTPTTPPSSTPG
ncbi:MAG: hypothetical protein R3C32_08130 [Chloroflexota bacterium]